MPPTPAHPKRLIEVDLPIRRISDHARREKSIRHGHISTLHIWWARRPLAACRAVLCAALWPDPADPHCPAAFRVLAAERMFRWAHEGRRWHGAESLATALGVRNHPDAFALGQHPTTLRQALLDFIADFANWDHSTVREFLETARALTAAAHLGLTGEPAPEERARGSFDWPAREDWGRAVREFETAAAGAGRPLVVDPFAGGGSIPLEALRVGADAFASDLNPVAVLLNKVVLEYLPRHGRRLADAVREWGAWVKAEAERELARFYPRGEDGSTPIAYLWARTVRCEGPGCGAVVPLLRSLWLAKKAGRSVALQLLPRPGERRCDFRIIVKTPDGWVAQDDREIKVASPGPDGTVRRGSATCPCCGYTTPVTRVRAQLKTRHGGADDAQLFCVVSLRSGEQGRHYRLPTETDLQAALSAREELKKRKDEHQGPFSLVPNESLDVRGIRHTWGMIYGLDKWENWFTARQNLALTTIVRLIGEIDAQKLADRTVGSPVAVRTCLALVLGRQADALSASVTWTPGGEFQGHTFARQALAFVWDFAEVNPWANASGNFDGAVEWVAKVCESTIDVGPPGHVERATATQHPLPDDTVAAFVTDPPYYDAVPYAYLADFFYVWLRRALATTHTDLFADTLVPKDQEIVVDRAHELSDSTHDIAFYERELTKAFAEGRRVARPDGIGTIVFASKTTASWEAILKAVIDAGWIITGSWPIDTERQARVSALGQARLASSVHLVVRPREAANGTVLENEVGDWRDVLAELPRRIHEWMPRLAEEGVVGADAIFACLGPALEIFSRYARVEKASGDPVPLREYLEHVWAAVALEALSLVFAGASAEGFEPDARLTAMWLWTLAAPQSANDAATGDADPADDDHAADDEDGAGPGKKAPKGFALEFDAARKIAQGLGADLDLLTHLVEVKGDQARLLPVAERTRHLFGKDQAASPLTGNTRRARPAQGDFFAELAGLPADGPGAEAAWGAVGDGSQTVTRAGDTTLDRVHQAMILFAASRGEALRRFLVEDAAGRDARFWRLAQALSALYPKACEEKRWVDGVLARKKGLGL